MKAETLVVKIDVDVEDFRRILREEMERVTAEAKDEIARIAVAAVRAAINRGNLILR